MTQHLEKPAQFQLVGRPRTTSGNVPLPLSSVFADIKKSFFELCIETGQQTFFAAMDRLVDSDVGAVRNSDRAALRRSQDRRRAWERTAIVALGIITLGIAACSKPRVDSESRPGVDLSELSTASIEVVVPAGLFHVTPALAGDIERSAAQVLEAKGYRIVPRAEARMLVVVAPRIETILRRSFDSDPDVGRVTTVPREEAMIGVRLIDRQAGHDVWRSKARSSIPRMKIPWARSLKEQWVELVVAALQEVDSIERERPALQ